MAAAAESIIDTHLHLLKPSRFHYSWLAPDSGLARDDDPQSVFAALREQGIIGGVLVEAAKNQAETPWLLNLTHNSHFELRVIGWLDLAHRDALSKIRHLAAQPFFRGVRLNWFEGFSPKDAHAQALKVLAAHNLVLELLTEVRFLPSIAAWVADYPQNHVVLDHMGAIGLSPDGFQNWQNALRCFRNLSHVRFKFSGFASPVSGLSPLEVIRRYLDTALEIVGAERLVCGSNYPMFEPTVTLAACHERLREAVAPLDIEVTTKLLHENARQLYAF